MRETIRVSLISAPLRAKLTTMWKNRLKPHDILSGEDVEAIHEQAMTILERHAVRQPSVRHA